MSYVVLARKWRPRFFREVVGQGHVARTLENAIAQDRVAHAYLFCGSRGVGKTTTARILAKALNCEQGPRAEPCYECPSCHEITAGQSIDVLEIDGASNRGINEIRELREGVRYTPSRSRFKIYIIDEVHMLTTEAFNALLKTLEEPPPHVKFIFATTEPQKIPVTILSRCQRFDFKRIGQKDIARYLAELCRREEIEAEQEALHIVARQAAGGMRDALSLLDQIISFAGKRVVADEVAQILGVANRAHLFDMTAAVINHDAEAALTVLDAIYRFGYDLHQFAGELVSHLRDVMVVRVTEHPERVCHLTEQEIELVRQQIGELPAELLHRYFSVMIDGAQEMSRSPYPKLLFEMTLVRMCQLEPLVGMDLLIDRLTSLEEGLEDGGVADPKKKVPERLSAPAHRAPDMRAMTGHAAPPLGPPGPGTPRPAPEAHRGASHHHPSPQPSTPQPSTPQPAQSASPVAPAPRDVPDGGAAVAPTFTAPAPRPAPPVAPPEPEAPAGPRIPTAPETPAAIAWKEIVDALRPLSEPLAATLEHAHVTQADASGYHLAFTEAFIAFVHDEERMGPMFEHLRALHGDGVPVHITVASEEVRAAAPTLAQMREELQRQRRVKLKEDTLAHPTIQHAVSIFGPTNMRVDVKLKE